VNHQEEGHAGNFHFSEVPLYKSEDKQLWSAVIAEVPEDLMCRTVACVCMQALEG